MDDTPGRRAITVVVADDEPNVVTYLCRALHEEGFVVVATAADADQAAQAVDRLEPDVALLDLRMPGGGVDAVQLIGSIRPQTRIVIFSGGVDEPAVLPLLRAGIDGYVLKGASPERLAEAIHSAVEGNPYLDARIARTAVGALTGRLNEEQQRELRLARERARIEETIATTAFHTVHQPVVRLPDRTPVAVEALTRFTGPPTRPPNEWFDDADRAGLRTSLELATASLALQDLDRLRADLDINLNVSPATVLSGRLGELLTGGPLPRIVLELTEHAPVMDYRELGAALDRWRVGGVRVAVDDAGGGYASFAHVLALRPDFIKLDLTLTREIHLDTARQALARAMVGFAADLGVGVIAEGVETAAELDTLLHLGVPLAQGFHLGRPRPLCEQPGLSAELRLDDDPARPLPVPSRAADEHLPNNR